MAHIQVTYMSQALWRSVPVQVILPADKASRDGELLPERKFKTLYLLHGLHGSSMDWITRTRIIRWAEMQDLAVVMPSGDNSYYVDNPAAQNRYCEFIGKELVEITRRMFPLSDRREDTFIGGLSMGGFGAILAGLKYPETFGRIVGLSSGLQIFEQPDCVSEKVRTYGETIFGPGTMEEAAASDKNPRVLLTALAEKAKADPSVHLPKIYMAIGESDFLLDSNRLYKKLFEENGYDLTYVEAPGDHNWDFWDTFIHEALQWLPLGDAVEAMGSGAIASDVQKSGK